LLETALALDLRSKSLEARATDHFSISRRYRFNDLCRHAMMEKWLVEGTSREALILERGLRLGFRGSSVG
jgi:hypothetical protein